MNNLYQDTQSKLNEASLFLNLMRHTESTRRTLFPGYGVEAQFSYLLSAYLSACYSVIAYMKEDVGHRVAAEGFRKQNPDFYANKRDGGWRTKAIHFSPVVPQHDGYIPPPGNRVNFHFGGTPYTPPKGDAVNFESTQPGAFYFTQESPQSSICDICTTHLVELREFVGRSFPNRGQ